MRRLVVPQGVQSMPIRRYLNRAFPAAKDWAIRAILKRHDVRVNGVRSGADIKVSGGDVIAVYESDRVLIGENRILYQNADLIVADKPPGIPVDADGNGIGEDTMLSRFRVIDREARLCHRLDTGTGGVLIAARNDAAYDRITALFKNHDLEKVYQCICVGNPKRDEGDLTNRLRKDAQSGIVTVVGEGTPGAAEARLSYRVIARRDGLVMLQVRLYTGRTHQIRVQLAHAGLPLLGDDKYGDRQTNRRYKTEYPQLWCTRIAIPGHEFESQCPFDMKKDQLYG